MLPELEQTTHGEIVRENLRAAQLIYTAYMLDELRMYQVVDRVVELFKQGMLPIARGPVVQVLASYAFDSTRPTEAQRRNVYARVFGAPGGDAGAAEPNTAFDRLWLRFVANVAEYARDARVQTLLWPRSAANGWVRRATYALAVSLSKRCAGETRDAARKLHEATEIQMSLLRDPQILQAFGARDAWQVIDHVNAQHLGGALNSARIRALSRAGSTLIAWLATWADGRGGSLSDSGASDEPSNDELVAAVNTWLAAKGISEADAARDAGPESASAEPDDAAGTPDSGPTQARHAARPPLLDASVQRALDELAAAIRGGGRGVSALFQGPTGTGKTVAVHLLASSLARDVLHIHLSQVVSPYLGETEKNLALVFDRAEAAGAVLLLDEADALFGKRTDVRDAHDRYADADVAYLLQRIEDFHGLAILESNLNAPIDDAVVRRLRAVVQFRPRSGE